MAQYSNLPPAATPTDNTQAYDTVRAMDNYYSTPIELNSTVFL